MKKWLIILVLPTFLLFGGIFKFSDDLLIDTYRNAYRDKFNRQGLSTGSPMADSRFYQYAEGSGFVLYRMKSNEKGLFISRNISFLDRIYYYPLTDAYFYLAQEFKLSRNFIFNGYLIFVYVWFVYLVLRIENDK